MRVRVFLVVYVFAGSKCNQGSSVTGVKVLLRTKCYTGSKGHLGQNVKAFHLPNRMPNSESCSVICRWVSRWKKSSVPCKDSTLISKTSQYQLFQATKKKLNEKTKKLNSKNIYQQSGSNKSKQGGKFPINS